MRISYFGGQMLTAPDFILPNSSSASLAKPRLDDVGIKSILVATDLSARDDVAVRRASQLALAHGASLKLMYMTPHNVPVPANAASRLAHAARQLKEDLELQVTAAPVKAYKLEHLIEEASGVDLVVLAHKRERSTAAFFHGQPVLRLVRSIACPVLVTRQEGLARYKRILVAVDFSAESEALVKLAADLDSHAELEIFHAIDTRNEVKLRSAEATMQAVEAYRKKIMKRAQDRMLSLTDSFDARRNRFLTVIGRGDPGRQTVVAQEHSKADLVVVGKRRSSVWYDFCCASVAHRVLSWGSSDVLVVPTASVRASAPIAARPLKISQGQAALGMQPAQGRAS